MLKWFIFAVLWVAGSLVVYSYAPKWAIVVYGVVTMGGLLAWAGLRKPASLNDKASPR